MLVTLFKYIVIGIVGKITVTCQGIVTSVEMYNDHAHPCVRFFSLILIGSTVEMYTCMLDL